MSPAVGSIPYSLPKGLEMLFPKVIFNVDFPDQLESYSFTVVANFASVVDSPAFKPWELGDVVNTRMDLEKRSIDESAIASELLHQAAFRTGLGNSLYAPDYMVINSYQWKTCI